MVGRFQQPNCATVIGAAAAGAEGAMYAMPQGRDAVAPGLGGDPAAAPRLDWRLPRGEQAADQFGSLPEPLFLGGLCRGGEFSLDLLQHARQRQRVRAGTDRRCDRSVDGRDLSPADTELDRWTSSNEQHISRPS